MKKEVTMIIGCPGSGKSWVSKKLADLYQVIPHDDYISKNGKLYVSAILKALESAKKPILIEAPFSISETKDALENSGVKVIPVFIQETDSVISSRYLKRENKRIPQSHLSRQRIFLRRAKLWNSFSGTTDEVVSHLKKSERSSHCQTQ